MTDLVDAWDEEQARGLAVLLFDGSKSDAAAGRVPEHASVSSTAGVRVATAETLASGLESESQAVAIR